MAKLIQPSQPNLQNCFGWTKILDYICSLWKGQFANLITIDFHKIFLRGRVERREVCLVALIQFIMFFGCFKSIHIFILGFCYMFLFPLLWFVVHIFTFCKRNYNPNLFFCYRRNRNVQYFLKKEFLKYFSKEFVEKGDKLKKE